VNHNLSEYQVAVNADIHGIDVIFVDEDDRNVSRLGAKGVGEIGIPAGAPWRLPQRSPTRPLMASPSSITARA
jgi:hypothetical protein